MSFLFLNNIKMIREYIITIERYPVAPPGEDAGYRCLNKTVRRVFLLETDPYRKKNTVIGRSGAGSDSHSYLVFFKKNKY
jgi:hypothetical protein